MASDPATEPDGTAISRAAAAAGAKLPETATDAPTVGPNTGGSNTIGSQPELADPCGIARERTDPRTLEMLVCPVTKLGLEYDDKNQELISRRAYLAYPIRCGVPLLTREAARALDS